MSHLHGGDGHDKGSTVQEKAQRRDKMHVGPKRLIIRIATLKNNFSNKITVGIKNGHGEPQPLCRSEKGNSILNGMKISTVPDLDKFTKLRFVLLRVRMEWNGTKSKKMRMLQLSQNNIKIQKKKMLTSNNSTMATNKQMYKCPIYTNPKKSAIIKAPLTTRVTILRFFPSALATCTWDVMSLLLLFLPLVLVPPLPPPSSDAVKQPEDVLGTLKHRVVESFISDPSISSLSFPFFFLLLLDDKIPVFSVARSPFSWSKGNSVKLDVRFELSKE